jgi:alkylation response protein AidB-like acyl-CoA dehydrogenase
MTAPRDYAEIRRRVEDFLAVHPVGSMPDNEFRAARFDAGLAFVTFAEGRGGLGAEPALDGAVEELFLAAGAQDWRARNVIGLGMAAPTIYQHGTAGQQDRWLKPGFTGAEIWWVRQLWYRAVAALAAEQVGGSELVVELCADYARERIQFGRRIGSFQTIKHRIVDMFVLAESARSATEAALSSASRMAEDLAISAAVAGSWCSEAYMKITSDAIQIHGGIGFTWEHPAHLYLKRAKASQLILGSPAMHRPVLAAELDLVSCPN